MTRRFLLSLILLGSIAASGCGGKSGSEKQHLGSWQATTGILYKGNGLPTVPGSVEKEKKLTGQRVYELFPGGVRLESHDKERPANLKSYTMSSGGIFFGTAQDMLSGMVRFREGDKEMAIFKDGCETVYSRLEPKNSVHRLWVFPSVESPDLLLALGAQGVYVLHGKGLSESGAYTASEASITWTMESRIEHNRITAGKGSSKEEKLGAESLGFNGKTFVPLKAPAEDFGDKFFAKH